LIHLEEAVARQLCPLVLDPAEVCFIENGSCDIQATAILGDNENGPIYDLVLALYNIAEAGVWKVLPIGFHILGHDQRNYFRRLLHGDLGLMVLT
jgi:hypothetical protein